MVADIEKQLKALADAIPQPAWMARPDGSIAWFNRHWYEFTGATAEKVPEWGHWDWANMQHPDHIDRVIAGYRHAFATGQPWQDTFPLRDRHGRWRWFVTRAAPIRDSAGRIERWFGTNTEVTEQVEATERLRESEARFRALVEASPLGIDILDMEGQPIYYNPRCEALHGIGLDQAHGEGWVQAVHPEDRQRVTDSWRRARASAQPWAQTYRFLHPDGHTVWVSGRAAPMYVGGRQVGYVGTLEDITELKSAESERERLLQQEHEALCRAQRATNQRDEVLGIVAHDLRSPLQLLVALSAKLVTETQSAQQDRSEDARLIRQTVDHMSRLVRDLLEVSMIEGGALVVAREDADVQAVIQSVLRSFVGCASEKGICLSLEPSERLPRVWADPGRLMQALSNLVGNAIKFTPAGGEVKIVVCVDEDSLEVSVSDTGPGISAEHLSHIFDRFWRAGQSHLSGAGLGLAIVKGIIEAHGGRIWADSTIGQGTTISFSLPLHHEHLASAPQASCVARLPGTSTMSTERSRSR